MKFPKRLCSAVSKLFFGLIIFFFVSISKVALFQEPSQNLVRCTKEAGGGFCPAGNTCCPIHDLNENKNKSGCIPNDISKDKLGVCCSDSTTGCAHGYSCDSRHNNNNKCIRDYSIDPWKIDHLTEVLPRYRLCSPPDGSLNTVYGLPVPTLHQPLDLQDQFVRGNVSLEANRRRQATTKSNMEKQQKIPKAIYHSTHGDIVSINSFPNIKMALIVVHGAGRNADDYFCSGTAASSLQTVYSKEEIIVLSPRFLSPTDSLHHLSTTTKNDLRESEILKWEYDRDGTWRYGASPIAPSYASTLSSYDVMDEFIQVLANRTKFPLLERISVAGHSSGGQFVQRWSLTSSSFVWDDERNDLRKTNRHRGDDVDKSSSFMSPDQTTTLLRSSFSYSNQIFRPKIYAIVANPSSYAYLDNRRYIHGEFQVPSLDLQQSCPTYNSWEWGFDVFTSSINSASDMDSNNDDAVPYPRHVPYVSRAVINMNGIHNLAKRYIQRNVVYLAGSLDRCNVTRHTSSAQLPKVTTTHDVNEYWCDSHGLETTCVDELQGSNRLERSENYFYHLKEYFQMKDEDELFRHERWIVNDVGHDHSLMFTSDVGMKAIFGG